METNSKAELPDNAFKAKSFLFIRKESGRNPTSNYLNTNFAKPYAGKLLNSRKVASNINTETTSIFTWRRRRRSPSSQALEIIVLNIPSFGHGSAQNSSSSTLSVDPSFCKVFYNTSHLNPQFPLPTGDLLHSQRRFLPGNLRKSSCEQRQEPPNCHHTFSGTIFVIVDLEIRRPQTGTLVYLKRWKPLLLPLPRKARTEGLPDEYSQYNNSCDKRAAQNTGSDRCTMYHRSATSEKLPMPTKPHACGYFLFSSTESEVTDMKNSCGCAASIAESLEFPLQVSDLVLSVKPMYLLRISNGTTTTVVHTATCFLDTGVGLKLIRFLMIQDE